MNKVLISEEYLTAIASAIRAKKNSTNLITPSEMANQIADIKTNVDIDIIVSPVLPDQVVNGRIVVISSTSTETFYIDTNAPEAPVLNDIWIKVDEAADLSLIFTDYSPYFKNGLLHASQYTGSKWQVYDAYLGLDNQWQQFSTQLAPVGSKLQNLTWEEISKISLAGKAPEYFKVGDKKQILIEGKIGTDTFSNVLVDAFIVGFNHNKDLEGNNTIHFQIGKIDSILVGIIDSKYGTTAAGSAYFAMKNANANSGGWKSSTMRTSILNSDNATTDTTAGMLGRLPAELKAVLRPVKKYTDNTGNSSLNSVVTTTDDFLWLPSEYEIFGTNTYGNAAESNYQAQYAYYAAGNDRIFYRHSKTTSTATNWLRSPRSANATQYCAINTSGAVAYANASNSYSISPMFCV